MSQFADSSIKAFEPADLDRVMELWLAGNLDAHSFIDKSYWLTHMDEVRTILPQAEVFVYEKQGEILGFLGIQHGYLAGIFVDRQKQSKGIGGKLLQEAKCRYPELTLHVYAENKQAISFYEKEDFTIIETHIEEGSGQLEYEMKWSEACVGRPQRN